MFAAQTGTIAAVFSRQLTNAVGGIRAAADAD
jgi:hypothetical protein